MKLTPDEAKWFDYGDGVRFKLKFDPDMGSINNSWQEIAIRDIDDWEGFENEDGSLFECTDLNKMNFLLSKEGKAMMVWIVQKVQSLHEFIDMSEVKKKLLDGSTGNGTTQRQVEKVV